MRALFRPLFILLLHAGGLGLIILGILDSSFLFLPFGNDLLVGLLYSQYNFSWQRSLLDVVFDLFIRRNKKFLHPLGPVFFFLLMDKY